MTYLDGLKHLTALWTSLRQRSYR